LCNTGSLGGGGGVHFGFGPQFFGGLLKILRGTFLINIKNLEKQKNFEPHYKVQPPPPPQTPRITQKNGLYNVQSPIVS